MKVPKLGIQVVPGKPYCRRNVVPSAKQREAKRNCQMEASDILSHFNENSKRKSKRRRRRVEGRRRRLYNDL
jgi:ribosomal protein S15P/S13E